MTDLADLHDRGYRCQAIFDVAALPNWVINPIRHADIDIGHFRRLVMLGQAGTQLWDTMEGEDFTSSSRFDDYSRRCVEELAHALGDVDFEVIYPSDVLLPLGRMAAFAGWGESSPLGLTINDRYGLWLAHRIVFLIDAPLAPTVVSSDHPCTTCADTPCVSACPVGAVSTSEDFDVDACSRFRIEDESPCADRCLARLACPIGTEYTYGPEQMSHHYAAGLESIKRWYRG